MKKVNRKNLPKWTRSLTAVQIKHLANDAGGLSLEKLKKNLAGQKRGDCWAELGKGLKVKRPSVQRSAFFKSTCSQLK